MLAWILVGTIAVVAALIVPILVVISISISFWTACLTATSRCWLSSALAFHLLVLVLYDG